MHAPDTGECLQIQPEAMADAWAAIDRNQSRLTLIFTEGEPLLREMEEEGQMPPKTCSHIRCLWISNALNKFHPLWAQRWRMTSSIASSMRLCARAGRKPI